MRKRTDANHKEKLHKKIKRVTFWQARKKARTAVQLHARLRHSDDNGLCSCCYCAKISHYKSMQGAHYIRSSEGSVEFDDINIHPACPMCNKLDKHHLYRDFLVRRYGEEAVKNLEFKARQICKRTVYDYQTIEKQYKEKIKQLQKQS